MSAQSRSGGGGGMHTSGYPGSQFPGCGLDEHPVHAWFSNSPPWSEGYLNPAERWERRSSDPDRTSWAKHSCRWVSFRDAPPRGRNARRGAMRTNVLVLAVIGVAVLGLAGGGAATCPKNLVGFMETTPDEMPLTYEAFEWYTYVGSRTLTDEAITVE